MKPFYVVTESLSFHDERTTGSIKAARKLQKRLQIEEDHKAKGFDAPPDTVRILRVEEVK
jgi:hypothetical protein